ncbi:hypothetical protein HQN89_30890 [Paenibacillus frigoriresistens]|uniref:hypothetical protein n=1 Tax=Paenibacillus alginolyticus TaxID=59839 RepID=UPI0015675DC6|nr:hypothetical protein [Paenibacillus frigoriresistens]NRF95289.1 hypothetical protein [Paenibacillus frigoriresistens]
MIHEFATKRILSYYEEDFDLGRLNEDLTNYVNLNRVDGKTYLPLRELAHDNGAFCSIPYSIALNRKSIQEQNQCLFSKDLITRRALSLYMLGNFYPRHADTLIGTRHKFTTSKKINNYRMAVRLAAMLEGWIKAIYGSPIVTSNEPSWFMEDSLFVSPLKSSKQNSFQHGYIFHNNGYKVGITVERHYNQMIQLSITVDSQHEGNDFWRNFIFGLAQELPKKTEAFKRIFTSSLPLFTQQGKIYRLMLYSQEDMRIMPMIYQRIFSSRTDEVFINYQPIRDPILNWDRVISEIKK